MPKALLVTQNGGFPRWQHKFAAPFINAGWQLDMLGPIVGERDTQATIAEVTPYLEDPETQAVILSGHGDYISCQINGTESITQSWVRQRLADRQPPKIVLLDTCDAMTVADMNVTTTNFTNAFAKGDPANLANMVIFGNRHNSTIWHLYVRHFEQFLTCGYSFGEAYDLALERVPDAAYYVDMVGNGDIHILEGPRTKYWLGIGEKLVEPCATHRELVFLGNANVPSDQAFNCLPDALGLDNSYIHQFAEVYDTSVLHENDALLVAVAKIWGAVAGRYRVYITAGMSGAVLKNELVELNEGGQAYVYAPVPLSLIEGFAPINVFVKDGDLPDDFSGPMLDGANLSAETTGTPLPPDTEPDYVFAPAAPKTVRISLIATPPNDTYDLQVWLSSDGITQAAVSNRVAFTASGGEQVFNLPLTMPLSESIYAVYAGLLQAGSYVAQVDTGVRVQIGG